MANKSNFRAGRNQDTLSENVELLTGQRGDGLDRAITLRELNNLGLAGLSRIGGIYTSKTGITAGTSQAGVVDFPSKPLNVSASGAFNTILITWDEPNYRGHSYAEIWRAETDNLAVAVNIGSCTANVYADAIGGDAHVYYWVRFVNRNNVPGPYNATAGTYAETGIDITQLLASLTNQITGDQLTQDLLTPINTVPSLSAYIAGDTSNLFVNPTFTNNSHGFPNQGTVRYNGYAHMVANCPTLNCLELNARDTLGKTVAVTPGDVFHIACDCATNDSASPGFSLGFFVKDKAGTIIAYPWVAHRDVTDAIGTWKRVSGNYTVPAGAASIQLWAQLDYFEPYTHYWMVTNVQFANANATRPLSALITEEQTARASGDSANASSITTLSATVNGNTAAIQTNASAIATTNATYSAQWSVKTTVGDLNGGFGIFNDGATTRFTVVANRFSIVDNSLGNTPFVPFVVDSGRVIIDTAFIKQAWIESLAAAQVTADRIATLSLYSVTITGGSLALGSGDASSYMQGGNAGFGKGGPYSGWGYNWHTIIYADGSLCTDRLYASAGSFTGTVNANAGTFNNVTINENCDVKGTIYANKIVGDVVAVKDYSIAYTPATRLKTIISGTFASSTKTRLLLVSLITLMRYGTEIGDLHVYIYINGAEALHIHQPYTNPFFYPWPVTIPNNANISFSVQVYCSDNHYFVIPEQHVQLTVIPTSSGTFI